MSLPSVNLRVPSSNAIAKSPPISPISKSTKLEDAVAKKDEKTASKVDTIPSPKFIGGLRSVSSSLDDKSSAKSPKLESLEIEPPNITKPALSLFEAARKALVEKKLALQSTKSLDTKSTSSSDTKEIDADDSRYQVNSDIKIAKAEHEDEVVEEVYHEDDLDFDSPIDKSKGSFHFDDSSRSLLQRQDSMDRKIRLLERRESDRSMKDILELNRSMSSKGLKEGGISASDSKEGISDKGTLEPRKDPIKLSPMRRIGSIDENPTMEKLGEKGDFDHEAGGFSNSDKIKQIARKDSMSMYKTIKNSEFSSSKDVKKASKKLKSLKKEAKEEKLARKASALLEASVTESLSEVEKPIELTTLTPSVIGAKDTGKSILADARSIGKSTLILSSMDRPRTPPLAPIKPDHVKEKGII
jgi:hypothetical protein